MKIQNTLNMSNRDNRIKDLVDGALSGQVAFHLFMMLGTGLGANIAAYPELITLGIPEQYAVYGAAIVGVIAAMSVDGFFKRGLPYAVSVLAGKKDRATGLERKRGFNVVVIALVALTGFVSIYLNFSITPEISSGIVKGPDQSRRDARIAAVVNKSDRDVAKLEKTRDNAREDLKKAEGDREEAITAAENHYGQEEGDRYRNKNGYSLKILRPYVDKAKRQHDPLVKAEQEKVNKAEADLAAFLASSTERLNADKDRINEEYDKAEGNAAASKGRWTYAFFLLWIVSFGGFIGCTAVVVMYEDETGEDVTHNPTIFSVTWKLIVRLKNRILRGVIKKGKLEYAFQMPSLASNTALQHLPTPPPERQKPAQSERKVRSQEGVRRKSECKTEKCQVKSEKPNSDNDRKSQKKSENRASDSPDNANTEKGSSRVEEWPAPNEPGWAAFCRKARQWWDYAKETDSASTRAINEQRWQQVIAHCNFVGYEATEEENKQGKLRPVIRKAAFGKPKVVVEGEEYEWTNGSF